MVPPCVSLRWHPLLFPLREGEGEWFASQKGEALPSLLDGRSAR